MSMQTKRTMRWWCRCSKSVTCVRLILVVAASSACCVASSGSSFVVGLQNLGNTCYLNAQLQCAFHIPRVRQLILTAGQLAESTATSSPPEDNYLPAEASSPPPTSIALQALRNLFLEMQQGTTRHQVVVAPRQLCATLGIPVMQQQDAQEFWKLLLPALQLPALTDLYQGAYEDYIVALDGSGRERRREEAFLDLSLDITTGSVTSSLQTLFGAPELLSEAQGNAWRPEKGADKVDAHKGTLLRSQGMSSILQLHLKRFQFDWTTEKTSKINQPFAFPVVLDLSVICEDTKGGTGSDDQADDRVVYDLQAVVVHAGEYESGHYYAYIRPNVETDKWYRFNDDVVDEVELKDVLCDAYGGRFQLDDESSNNKNIKGQGILAFFKRAFQPKGPTHGYGGPTSNAYVLQYVRRADIPMLYPGDECVGEQEDI